LVKKANLARRAKTAELVKKANSSPATKSAESIINPPADNVKMLADARRRSRRA
jgi:hypothetical protein